MNVAELDLRGLKCPLPVLKLRKVLARMLPDERISVICTDPLSVIDIPHLIAQTGDALLGQSVMSGDYKFDIRKV